MDDEEEKAGSSEEERKRGEEIERIVEAVVERTAVRPVRWGEGVVEWEDLNLLLSEDGATFALEIKNWSEGARLSIQLISYAMVHGLRYIPSITSDYMRVESVEEVIGMISHGILVMGEEGAAHEIPPEAVVRVFNLDNS